TARPSGGVHVFQRKLTGPAVKRPRRPEQRAARRTAAPGGTACASRPIYPGGPRLGRAHGMPVLVRPLIEFTVVLPSRIVPSTFCTGARRRAIQVSTLTHGSAPT